MLRLTQLVFGKPVAAPCTVLGLTVANPVGLAAGLDKNGDYIDALAALGFGFIEIGTVTPLAQPGNPKPRLFRLPAAHAIINRMGFNNKGVDYLVKRVKASKYCGVLGINIGKNKDTPAEKAVDDYLVGLRKVYPLASYITVNLSSPNTPGLRDLQFGEPLEQLLAALKSEQQQLAQRHGKSVPLLVKLAPDMAEQDLRQVAEALLRHSIDGVIATNTTIARDQVGQLPHGEEPGGLSGEPLCAASTRAIQILAGTLKGRMPIIGVGGIHNIESALEKKRAGAQLLQVYTGFIYQGPALIAKVVNCLKTQR